MVIADFLCELAGNLPHEGGLCAATLKRYAGELYSALRLVGHPIERDELFFALEEVKRGLLNRPDKRKPAVPKSDVVYDLKLVTEYWDNQPANNQLPLDVLRLKAVSLLMIAGLARPSDLARLDLDSLQNKGSSLWIWVWRAKNSGAGYSAPMVIAKLPDSQASHCPYRALLAYLEEVAPLRHANPSGSLSATPVFISSQRPYGGLSADRVSVLVRDLLRSLGIDASTYSIRKRATTSALEAGVAPANVQAGGRWRSMDTMWKHYVRPSDPASAGVAAISGNKRSRRR